MYRQHAWLRSLSLLLALAASTAACGGGGGGDGGMPASEPPIGYYEGGYAWLDLAADGNGVVHKKPTSLDPRNYELRGTYTFTHDGMFGDNQFGKFTLYVSSLSENGFSATGMYLGDNLQPGSYAQPGDVLEGWWAYSDYVVTDNKLRVYLNWPGIPRGPTYYDGHNMLFSGNPP